MESIDWNDISIAHGTIYLKEPYDALKKKILHGTVYPMQYGIRITVDKRYIFVPYSNIKAMEYGYVEGIERIP